MFLSPLGPTYDHSSVFASALRPRRHDHNMTQKATTATASSSSAIPYLATIAAGAVLAALFAARRDALKTRVAAPLGGATQIVRGACIKRSPAARRSPAASRRPPPQRHRAAAARTSCSSSRTTSPSTTSVTTTRRAGPRRSRRRGSTRSRRGACAWSASTGSPCARPRARRSSRAATRTDWDSRALAARILCSRLVAATPPRTWIFLRGESRRRRGCDVDIPWRRDVAAATWIFRGGATPRPRRGYSVETLPRLSYDLPEDGPAC